METLAIVLAILTVAVASADNFTERNSSMAWATLLFLAALGSAIYVAVAG